MVEPVEAEINDRIGLYSLSTLSRYPRARRTPRVRLSTCPKLEEMVPPLPSSLRSIAASNSGVWTVPSKPRDAIRSSTFHCLKVVPERAKLDQDNFWLHKFPATFATRCLWAGVDLRTVQQWLILAKLRSLNAKAELSGAKPLSSYAKLLPRKDMSESLSLIFRESRRSRAGV